MIAPDFFICNRCNLSAWRVVLDKDTYRAIVKRRKKYAPKGMPEPLTQETFLELQCISCEKHGGHNNIKVVVTGVCL